jgi:hypothetical protein
MRPSPQLTLQQREQQSAKANRLAQDHIILTNASKDAAAVPIANANLQQITDAIRLKYVWDTYSEERQSNIATRLVFLSLPEENSNTYLVAAWLLTFTPTRTIEALLDTDFVLQTYLSIDALFTKKSAEHFMMCKHLYKPRGTGQSFTHPFLGNPKGHSPSFFTRQSQGIHKPILRN